LENRYVRSLITSLKGQGARSSVRHVRSAGKFLETASEKEASRKTTPYS